MYYRMCLFFLCLLFPSLGFSQEYIVVKQDTTLYTDHTGDDALTSHLKKGFMDLEVLERKNKRIRVKARDRSYSPCIEGIGLSGFELEFWVDEASPVQVLKKYKKWEFSDGSVVELAAGVPITKNGAGDVVVPVKPEDKSLSYRRGFVPNNGRLTGSCWGQNCPVFKSKKGLRYNGDQYYYRDEFYGEEVRSQCLLIKGKLEDGVKITQHGGGGALGRSGGTDSGKVMARTPVYTATNKPIGQVVSNTDIQKWEVKGDLSCLRKYRSRIQICVKTTDIQWGQKWLPTADKFPRAVVKRNTKFYTSESGSKPTLHLRKAKGYATLVVLEKTPGRIKVRLLEDSPDNASSGCYQNFWVPSDLRMEFWIDRSSLLDITTKRTYSNYPDRARVSVGAGLIVTKNGIQLENTKFRAKIDENAVGKFVEKSALFDFKSYTGKPLLKASKLPKKKKKKKKKRRITKTEKLAEMFGSVQGFDSNIDGLLTDGSQGWGVGKGGLGYGSGRGFGRKKKPAPVFFTSKKGIKYGKHHFKFPPMQIYQDRKQKEVGTRCWRIEGQIAQWKIQPKPKKKRSGYRPGLDWGKRIALAGAPVFSKAGASVGIVRVGLSERAKTSNENEKLVCKSVELAKGAKTFVCLQDKSLIDPTPKQTNKRKAEKVTTTIEVDSEDCDAGVLLSQLNQYKYLKRDMRRQRKLGSADTATFLLRFHKTGKILSVTSLTSTLAYGESGLKRTLAEGDYRQTRACKSTVILNFEVK